MYRVGPGPWADGVSIDGTSIGPTIWHERGLYYTVEFSRPDCNNKCSTTLYTTKFIFMCSNTNRYSRLTEKDDCGESHLITVHCCNPDPQPEYDPGFEPPPCPTGPPSTATSAITPAPVAGKVSWKSSIINIRLFLSSN